MKISFCDIEKIKKKSFNRSQKWTVGDAQIKHKDAWKKSLKFGQNSPVRTDSKIDAFGCYFQNSNAISDL